MRKLTMATCAVVVLAMGGANAQQNPTHALRDQQTAPGTGTAHMVGGEHNERGVRGTARTRSTVQPDQVPHALREQQGADGTGTSHAVGADHSNTTTGSGRPMAPRAPIAGQPVSGHGDN